MKSRLRTLIINLVVIAIDALITVLLCGIAGDFGLLISAMIALTLYKFANGL